MNKKPTVPLAASASVRIDLFGNWSDHPDLLRFRNSRVVNCAVYLSHGSMPVTVTVAPSQDRTISFHSVDLGFHRTVDFDEIGRHPVTAALSMVYCLETRDRFQATVAERGGLMLTTHSQVPFKSGLGASASLVVATLRCLAEMTGHDLIEQALAETAYRAERTVHVCGWQDHYSAALQGALLIERSVDAENASVTRLSRRLSEVLAEHGLVVLAGTRSGVTANWGVRDAVIRAVAEMDGIVDRFLDIQNRVDVRQLMTLAASNMNVCRRFGPADFFQPLDRLLERCSGLEVAGTVLGAGPAVLLIAADRQHLEKVLSQAGGYTYHRVIPV